MFGIRRERPPSAPLAPGWKAVVAASLKLALESRTEPVAQAALVSETATPTVIGERASQLTGCRARREGGLVPPRRVVPRKMALLALRLFMGRKAFLIPVSDRR